MGYSPTSTRRNRARSLSDVRNALVQQQLFRNRNELIGSGYQQI